MTLDKSSFLWYPLLHCIGDKDAAAAVSQDPEAKAHKGLLSPGAGVPAGMLGLSWLPWDGCGRKQMWSMWTRSRRGVMHVDTSLGVCSIIAAMLCWPTATGSQGW